MNVVILGLIPTSNIFIYFYIFVSMASIRPRAYLSMSPHLWRHPGTSGTRVACPRFLSDAFPSLARLRHRPHDDTSLLLTL